MAAGAIRYVTLLNLREKLGKWRWILFVFYGTMLFIIMANFQAGVEPNGGIIRNDINPNVPQMAINPESGDNLQKTNEMTLDKNSYILERYKKYIRSHNITVTLFTTFADREESRYVIQNNTLLNWMQLQNVNFKLVLFGNTYEMAKYHLQHTEDFKRRLHLRKNKSDKKNHFVQPRVTLKEPGLMTKLAKTSFPSSGQLYTDKSFSRNSPYYQTWDFITLEKNLTAQGRPILKRMFAEVQRRYDSDLYMYANGDILFHAESLLQSLYAVKQYVDDPMTKKEKWIVFGGRREVNFYNKKRKKYRALDFGDDAEIQKVSLGSRVINHNALDFFISSRSSFNWEVVPEFVISLPYFDYWLVLYSNKVGIETIDISGTALVVHQQGVKKLKDLKYSKANDLNTFLFNSAVGIRCAFETYQAKLQCMKQKTSRSIATHGEDAVIIDKNDLFNTFDCIYPYPVMIPVVDPVSEQDSHGN